MTCNGCGNEAAHRVRVRPVREPGDDKNMPVLSESCDRCAGLRNLDFPDVSFTEPYMDPNLAHPDRPWEVDGVWIESKRHKAMLMKEQDLREIGDRKGGARNFDPALAERAREQGFNQPKDSGRS